MFGLILSMLLTFSFIQSDDVQDYSRYFVEADSLEQAEIIAEEMDAELLSFSDGIATYHLNRPFKEFLRNANINTYATEEVGNIDGQEITLSQDAIYFPTEFEKGCTPCLNEKFKRDPFLQMEWENTYKNGITGKGTVVAVIDTGCYVNHEDLKDNIIGTYNSTDGTRDVTDENGHGTHVCGTIAARDNTVGNIGVAPDADLYPIKASTQTQNNKSIFYTSDIIKALNKCVELGNINVINMSLGGGIYQESFKKAIENCMDHGILCVMAAGNDGSAELHYPSGYGIGLTVAASDPGMLQPALASFSNYGANANIVAPGVSIVSTYNLSKDAYAKLSGTSMASPHVAGVAALVYGEYNFSKNRIGAEKAKNLILNANDGITYTYRDHSVTGGVDLQNIFHANFVRTPEQPKISVEEESGTLQQIVTIKASTDVYYTLDGTTPNVYTSKKYTEPIRIDKKGAYNVCAISMTKRCSSTVDKKDVKVSSDVISQKQIESVELSCDPIPVGGSAKIKVTNNGGSISNKRFKWKSKNTDIATVNNKGKVTVSEKAKPGDKVKIIATIGDYKFKVKIEVK